MQGYDLDAASVRFLFRVSVGTAALDLLVEMRPYVNTEMHDLLRDTEVIQRDSKDEEGVTDILPAGQEKVAAFFNAHHIRTLHRGVELTAEQLEKLDARCDFKAAVIRDGYNGVQDPPQREAVEIVECDEAIPDLDALLATPEIPTLFPSVGDNGEEIKLPLNHALCETSAKHRQDWKRRLKLQRIDGRTIRQAVNHRLVEALYDAMIRDLSGFRMGDVPCGTGNLSLAKPKIPYLMKWYVLTRNFEGNTKNA